LKQIITCFNFKYFEKNIVLLNLCKLFSVIGLFSKNLVCATYNLSNIKTVSIFYFA